MDNVELNKLEIYKDRRCSLCDRKYPKTVLNIEGTIHHGNRLTCIDSKSCKRAKRKKQKAR